MESILSPEDLQELEAFGEIIAAYWYIIIPTLLFVMIFKGIALWKSGRNNQLSWFVALFILNTLGILPIIYLLAFQKKHKS